MHGRRLRSLRGALLLAAGFVVLRVVYRVVFGGAGGGGIVLLDAPRIRLSGPFEHVVLFGPITTGGVANAAITALPFAALLLAFGLLSVIVDIRALLARGAVRGPVRTVSRVLVIAWATFPAMLDSVRRVRVARDLRGARGAASLIVPVLEQTVERAIALGASMEVRGFSALRRAEPRCEHPARLAGVSLGYGDSWTLAGVDLEFAPGTLTLVTGATGSGKSTLLHALSGLFQHVSDGQQRGVIEVGGVDRRAVPPRETAGFVGVVSQSVRLSFVAPTVAEELGFALANRGVAPVIVRARVEELAERLGIGDLLDREIHALSAGQAALVGIGAAIVENPVLLIVDEPLADLDDRAGTRVIDVLDRLAHEAGVCVIVAEHALGGWGTAPDARLDLRDGGVHPVAGPVEPELAPVRHAVPGPIIAEARGVTVRHGERLAVDDASLTLAAGQLVALRGPNGAGKSSLLHALARPAAAGTVIVDGVDVHGLRRRDRRHAVALVPEAYDDLLFALTVGEECARSGALEIFEGLVGRDLRARHPRDLSAGERLCLVLALQLSAHPRVLLVDEPSRGLDAAARELVGGVLLAAAASGAAVVIATHDGDFADRFATRTVRMADGRIDATAGVAR